MMMASPTVDRSGYSATDLSLRDILTVVFKRRRIILVFAACIVLLSTLMMALTPPTYEVEATLLVNKARAEIPIAPKESPQLIISQVGEEELNSEIEILKSRQLIEEVLDDLGGERPASPTSWVGQAKAQMRAVLGGRKLSYRDQMILLLQEEIAVNGVRKSNVIRVRYRSKDPEFATRMVGTLVDRYLDRRAKMYQSPQAVSFFDKQMAQAGEQLADREAKLEQFLATSGITMVKGPQGSDALSAQKKLIMERLARAQNDLADAEAEVEESQYRAASLRNRILAEPERLESSNRLNQQAAAEEIEKGLAALELERDRLLQDFKPDSRYVRDIDTQIELARTRLAEIETEGGSIDRTEINPVYQQLKTELLRAETQLEGARGRLESLQTQVTNLRAELDSLNAKAFELERLRREAQAAEDSYLLYRKKHEEARISAAMDQQKLINVTVAQPAQKPLRPISRNLRLSAALALLFGLAGGLGLAFGTEFYLDHTLTTGEEMERRLGISHLASIPEEI